MLLVVGPRDKSPRGVGLAILLCAVLLAATVTILYVAWPIAFALAVAAAVVWCRRLDRGVTAS